MRKCPLAEVQYHIVLHNKHTVTHFLSFFASLNLNHHPAHVRGGEGKKKNTSKTQPVILKQPAANCTSRLIKATGKLLPADFLQISPVIPHELWHYCLTTQPQINLTPGLTALQLGASLCQVASPFQCLHMVLLMSSKVPLLWCEMQFMS